MNMRK